MSIVINICDKKILINKSLFSKLKFHTSLSSKTKQRIQRLNAKKNSIFSLSDSQQKESSTFQSSSNYTIDKEINISNLNDSFENEEQLQTIENEPSRVSKIVLGSPKFSSFIQFSNNLKAKAASDNESSTSSYQMALCPELYAKRNVYNYFVDEMIKEENEDKPKRFFSKNDVIKIKEKLTLNHRCSKSEFETRKFKFNKSLKKKNILKKFNTKSLENCGRSFAKSRLLDEFLLFKKKQSKVMNKTSQKFSTISVNTTHQIIYKKLMTAHLRSNTVITKDTSEIAKIKKNKCCHRKTKSILSFPQTMPKA